MADREARLRHEVIDALRGFALAGVALVNLRYLSLYALLPKETREALPSAGFDGVVLSLMGWLLDAKFITLFSLLFGLGFALQVERDDRAASAGDARRYLRRVLGLALIGALHGWCLWWGDILLTYAAVALLMLPLSRLGDRMLLLLALVLALLPGLVAPWVRPWLPPLPSGPEAFAQGLAAFSTPSLAVAFQGNAELANWARMSNWGLLCFVLSRFLLGYWAGRRGLLQDPARHLGLLRRLCIGGGLLGLALLLVAGLQAELREAVPLLQAPLARRALRMVGRLESIAIGVAYASGFVLLFLQPAWRRWLGAFAPVGRMALTHYLLQSVAGVGLFYAIGFGIGPGGGLWPVLLAWAAIFGLQLWISPYWLARYHHGPVEWLWRWSTRGERPPFRRRPATAPAPAATA